MRALTLQEIELLERQGCTARNWESIHVHEDFTTAHVYHTSFNGKVEIGKEVHLDHVGLIENYTIGDCTTVCRVNELVADTVWPGDFFNEGVTVGNEAGSINIPFKQIHNEYIDWLELHYPQYRVRPYIPAENNTTNHRIGSGSVIRNSGTIRNVNIAPNVTIDGAAHLENGILHEESHIGTLVIARTFSIGPRTRVTDGVKLYHVITTNDCKIGKGFMAENCYFSHHCELFCGEACAVFAGPHTVSHHKSTLLIGGEFSFYNAGSNTNQSNHAYKLGPIHHGTLARGSKTASGCHILWPMQTAPFTMIMGKVKTHPDLSALPFSYVIAEGEKVYVAPGINLGTAGTFRDILKWKQRGKTDYTGEYDFLSPWVMQSVFKGIEVLENLQREQGKEAEEYTYNRTFISRRALLKGLDRYELAIRLFAGKISPTKDIHDETDQWHWMDVAGLPLVAEHLPKSNEQPNLLPNATAINLQYAKQMQQWGATMLARHYGARFCSGEMQASAPQALEAWKKLIIADAYKEYELGDMEAGLLSDFTRKVKATDYSIF